MEKDEVGADRIVTASEIWCIFAFRRARDKRRKWIK